MRVRQTIRRVVLTAAAVMAAVSCSRDPETAKREHFARGEKYVEQQKHNEAIVEYRNAVQQDPRFGEARSRLADAYVKVENWPGALAESVRAADLLPQDVAVQLKAGGLLLMAGRFQDAKGRAEKVLALDAGNVDAHILHGNAFAGLKDLKSALAEIEEAIELDPTQSQSYLVLGVLELAREKKDRAETAFKKAVELDPQSVNAKLALGNYHFSIRNLVAAEDTFKAAVNLAPKHAVANRALATFYLATNRVQDAEPYLKVLAAESTDPGPHLALADYYLGTNRVAEAVTILETLATQKNAFASAKIRLATMEFAQGRKEAAHRIIDEILARDPKNPQTLLLKGRLLFAEGKLDQALALVQEATVAGPRYLQAHYALGQIYMARQDLAAATKAFNDVLKLNPRAAAAQVQISRLHLVRRAPEAAVQFAEEAVKNHPRSAEGHLALAKGLLAKGELTRAEAELTRLVKSQPNAAVVHAQIGLLRLAKSDSPGAKRSFDRALELDSNHVQAMAGLVAVDINNKQIAAAQAKVAGWLATSPGNAALHLLAARTYAIDRDLVRAEQSLRKVIELDPAVLEAYSALGQIYMATNRLPQALQEFEEVSKRRPKSIGAHTLVAMILQVQNRIPEARERYQRVLAIDARSPVAANNLAWLYAESGGNLDVAVDLALTARAGLPDQAAVSDTLGWIYYKKDRPEQAIAALRDSIAKEPQNPVYHFHLGLAYAKAGEGAKARVALERALELRPDFAGATEARKILSQLQQS